MEIQNYQEANSKMTLVSLYISVVILTKWIEFTNEKAQSGQMDKKTRPNYKLPTRASLQF